MKYTALILLFACFAGCKKDDFEMSNVYSGSAVVTYSQSTPKVYDHAVTYVDKVNRDSVNIFLRIAEPLANPADTVYVYKKFGALVGSGGDLTVPECTDSSQGVWLITGTGSISKSAIDLSLSTKQVFGPIVTITFNGTAQ